LKNCTTPQNKAKLQAVEIGELPILRGHRATDSRTGVNTPAHKQTHASMDKFAHYRLQAHFRRWETATSSLGYISFAHRVYLSISNRDGLLRDCV
jgi:hypothetical protein